jgi:hypothetical protein
MLTVNAVLQVYWTADTQPGKMILAQRIALWSRTVTHCSVRWICHVLGVKKTPLTDTPSTATGLAAVSTPDARPVARFPLRDGIPLFHRRLRRRGR